MADLAQLDLSTKGGEARVRALLEDLLDYRMRGLQGLDQMALAVWYGKSPSKSEHDLLALFIRHRRDGISLYEEKLPLCWLAGSKEPPFVNIWTASVECFQQMIKSNPAAVAQYRDSSEVLYFDKDLLPEDILQFFDVITEPSGLVKGWYLTCGQYRLVTTGGRNLVSWYATRPEIGIVQIWEAPNFEYRRGLLHVEIGHRWLPLSPGALPIYSFYNDLQDQKPGKFLLEGGSLYDLLKVEVKTNPEYSAKVRQSLRDSRFTSRDDRYAELYLRAVHPPEKSAA